MKYQDRWQPSRFCFRDGTLIPSCDPGEVGYASRLVCGRLGQFLSKVFPQHCRGRLLDLGCGKVPYYEAYKDHVADIVCVDWELSFHGNQHIDFACDLTKPLPFKTGEFDTVLLLDVLEHVPNPQEVWCEIARILRPGGKLILTVPFYYWLHEQPHDYYRYTEFALRRFAENVGISVLELEPTGGSLEVLTDILAKNVLRVRWVGRPICIALQWACSKVGYSSWGKRIQRVTAPNFPLGYGLVGEKKS